MLGVGGTVLGILMSYGAYWMIRTLVPASIPMIIVYAWWPIAGGDHAGRRRPGSAIPRAERRPARPHRGPGV